ncbi:pyridoxamine 5'-phosphate oxidase [Robiginitomaculum antarcticum]|uniref:pyridoxamine 5'-phosphate oxidase n=1 Tax=Robiginitomaculum antarcticum TaxID=437507 RepID=UPI0003756B70|nr:pyridoxamine 5'-phosphate oxidase [Robiginitomaculum antarcticum]
MPKSVIPPSPSAKDYTQDDTYRAVQEANARPIFDRDDPIALFEEWMGEARVAELNDSNAMALSTVDASGRPDVRMVLLKGVDARGFTFYTNSGSAKGEQLSGNGAAALCFHWKSLRRQVRVRGPVMKVSDAESDEYFASRARGSRIGAWASDQSEPVKSREALEAAVKAAQARFEGVKDIPRPDNWFGWRVVPMQIEFWRDRPYRLHDRLLFSREEPGSGWDKMRLYP